MRFLGYNQSMDDELHDIAANIADVLKENFIGFYIFGSYAMGSWDPQKSDIDVMVVLRQPLTEEEHAKLSALHGRIAQLETGKRLEGEYIALELLQQKRYSEIVGGIEKGKFNPYFHCQISADNVLALIQHGKVVRGKAVQDLGLSVSESEFRAAVLEMLREDREELEAATGFKDMYYLLIDGLRGLYVLETGKLPTKPDAVEHGKQLLGDELYQKVKAYVGDGQTFQIETSKVREVLDYALSRENFKSSGDHE